jgi:hypothetical protein
MLRIAATLLVFLAWHGPTTFFVPSGPPHDSGWVVWPFGQQSRPVVDALVGVFAPDKVTTNAQPTVALVAAGVASLAFIVAGLALWGFLVPASWWAPALVAGAVCSLVLFAIYLSPLALIPLVVDAVILWGVIAQGWSVATFAGAT